MKISIQSIYTWYRQLVRNPKYRWWVVLATLAYLVIPTDLSFDLLPIAGQLDDAIVVTLLVSELSQVLIDQYKTKNRKTANPVEQN